MTFNRLFSIEDHNKRSLKRKRELTLLPVGDNFIACNLTNALSGEGILHADLLYCERVNKVESGQLAIVNTPYGLLLRRYYMEGVYVRLEAANARFPTLCLPPQGVHVIGRPYKLERDVRRESEAA